MLQNTSFTLGCLCRRNTRVQSRPFRWPAREGFSTGARLTQFHQVANSHAYSRAYRGQTKTNPWSAFLNRLPPKSLVIGILAAHGGVFLLWHLATSAARTGEPELLIWMGRNFTASLTNLREGRLWTSLSCSVSHNGVGHLLFNSFTLWFIGLPVAEILGVPSFLALYLGGAVVSSFSSIAWNYVNNSPHRSSMGASGALYATVSFLALKAPRMMFYLYGVIPIPAWAFIPGMFAWEGWSVLSSQPSRTDHAGHIGGLLAGIAYFLLV